ncbi:MAG TPA: ketoacyl-ACP synthase III family protein [Pseudonocardiaceae bacterium]|nr:ketoacyl-ACP synthase III family protein [Pseudonocardiaceae bacterium]
MRIDPLVRIVGLATELPATTETTAWAVRAGRLSEQDAQGSGYTELPVAGDVAAPQLAAGAATSALRVAGLPAEDLDLVAHAWTHYQGHDFWSPAHYVAAATGAHAAEPVGVQQMCNGGAAALTTAVTRLLADPGTHRALVTTADCFGAPGFDRWRGDYGVLYGDSGTAAVLTDEPVGHGLDLLAVSTVAAPELERMHRGDDPFHPAGRMPTATVDVRRTKKAYLAMAGKEAFGKTVATRVHDVLAAGLADAGIDAGRPRLVLLPRLGATGLTEIYRPAVATVLPAPAIDLGGHTGHLGAGDLIANLTVAVDEDLLRPGDVAVALSAGAGFTWTCVVVRRPHRDERTNS